MPLPSEQLLQIYYYLVLTRTLEDKIAYICHSQNIQQPMIIGKGYLSTGQEAISVGATSALEVGDWFAPSHRDMGGLLVRGMTPRQIFLQYFCRASSPTRGRDGNVHMGDISKNILYFVSHMGGLLPVANGLAAAFQYRKEKHVVLACFGDGASSQGVVHEAINYASVFGLPVVFVLNNNHYAISTPLHQQSHVEDLSLRAIGYGIPGKTIDGNNVLEVYRTVREAVDLARRGEGPSLVECKTLRIAGHGTHDPASYIDKDYKDTWKRRDPIVLLRHLLEEKKILNEKREAEVAERVEGEIAEAIEYARNQPVPEAEDLLKE